MYLNGKKVSKINKLKLYSATELTPSTTSSIANFASDGYNGVKTINVTAVDPTPYLKPEISLTASALVQSQTLTPPNNNVFNVITLASTTADIDQNIKAENIANGITILGVTGNYNTQNSEFNALATKNISGVYSNNTISFIGNGAFRSCVSLAAISFPECISISANAFNYCIELSSIYLPKCTTIGEGTFEYCNNRALTTISLPSFSMSYIPTTAFRSCWAITAIQLSADAWLNIKSIGGGAFASCNNLASLAIGWNDVTYIGGAAFGGCSKVNFGTLSLGSCTYIGDGAFRDCKVNGIYLGKCEYIGNYAFSGCANFNFVSFYPWASVIPTITSLAFVDTTFSSTGRIYAYWPMYENLKTAPGWSYYSSRIVSL